MSQQITLAQLKRWLLRYADRIDQEAPYLTELDAAIGDADHGVNMQQGMHKLRQRLLDMDDPGDAGLDVSGFLRMTAMTLISSIGGAAGPLYGSFFLHAARTAPHATTVDVTELANLFRSGLTGVRQRGKARPDDKTMIDALEPAVAALERAAANGSEVSEAMAAATRAAEQGMLHTIGLEARKGRASYLGPRSIGHQDPGATSAYLLIQTAAEAFNENGVSEQAM